MVNEWRRHCGKYLSWREQKDLYGTAKGFIANGSKEPITAYWYNNLVSSLGEKEAAPIAKVTGGPNGTIIHASHFTQLDGYITKTGNVGNLG